MLRVSCFTRACESSRAIDFGKSEDHNPVYELNMISLQSASSFGAAAYRAVPIK